MDVSLSHVLKLVYISLYVIELENVLFMFRY